MHNTYPLTIKCSSCSGTYQATAYSSINVSNDPELKDKVRSGELFISTCPHCGKRNMIRCQTLYHDPEHRLMILSGADEKAAAAAEVLTGTMQGLEEYTLRLTDTAGEMIEKINIVEAGLDDIAVELCKYATKLDMKDSMKDMPELPGVLAAPFKFLRMDGADNALVLAYPLSGRMEMVQVPFSMYENCCGIVSRNPIMKQKATGFVRVDSRWLSDFIK